MKKCCAKCVFFTEGKHENEAGICDIADFMCYPSDGEDCEAFK